MLLIMVVIATIVGPVLATRQLAIVVQTTIATMLASDHMAETLNNRPLAGQGRALPGREASSDLHGAGTETWLHLMAIPCAEAFHDLRTSWGPISAAPSPAQQIEEQLHSIGFLVEMMDPGLAICSDAPPSSCHAGCAEQCRLDGKYIEARHVFRGIRAFNIKMVGLLDHGARIARTSTLRPTILLNQWTLIDSFLR